MFKKFCISISLLLLSVGVFAGPFGPDFSNLGGPLYTNPGATGAATSCDEPPAGYYQVVDENDIPIIDENGDCVIIPIDFFVNSTTGNDSTGDGSIEAPWATIHKALRTVLTDGKIIDVAAGNYYDEGETAQNIVLDANAVIIRTTGRVNIRVSEDTAAAYVFRPKTIAGGGWTFSGDFYFDQKYFGDGSANTGKYFFFLIVATDMAIKFSGCEINGGGGAKFAGSSIADLVYDRCKIYDFASTPQIMSAGSSITMIASYLNNITGMQFGSNAVGVTLNLRNNTWVDVGAVGHSGSTTYLSITIQNNAFYSSSATVMTLNNVAAYTMNNNAIFRTGAAPEPRTAIWYPGIRLDITGFYDNSFYFDPDFNTAPALSSTSLAIGRGTDASVTNAYTRDGGGDSTFDNSGLPMIGCFAPSSGSKQFISQIAKKVVMTGDSFTVGTGASDLDHAYFGLIWGDIDFSTYTFVKMPGDTTTPIGISGAEVEAIGFMAQEFAVSESASIVTVLGGVNDIRGGDNLGGIGGILKSTILNLNDLGVGKTIYIGTQIESSETPTYSGAVTVETDVETVVSGDIKKVSITQNILLQADWENTLYADDVHFNDAGHAFLASLLKPVILATE